MIDTERLIELKDVLQRDCGEFSLFALFLREDAPGKWDLVVAAPWIDEDKKSALKKIAERVSAGLSQKELLEVSRIVVLDPENPALEATLRAVKANNSKVEVRNSNFFGLQIKHAVILESKRVSAEAKQAEA
jgi:hypothetical protein